MKKNIILLFLIICSLTTYSQKQTFQDSATFLVDLRNYMKIALNDKEIVSEIDTFQYYWNTNKIGEMYKVGIVLTSNILALRYAKANTHMFYYLKTINGFVRKNNLNDYQEWEVGLIELVDIQKELMTKVESYLQFSSNFVNYNILMETSTLVWRASPTTFKMSNDVTKQTMTVEFDDFNLTCYSKSDSFTIFQTKGIFYPVEKKFVGQNGMVTWERVGLSSDSVYALIQNYEVNMQIGELKAENVSLANKTYLLEKTVLGSFEDKLMGASALLNPTYPKFYSYDDNIEVKNIMPNINYKGCFNMEGIKFVGKGSKDNYANIEIMLKGHEFITVSSQNFNFYKDKKVIKYPETKKEKRPNDTISFKKITASDAFTSIRFSEKDSIYHYKAQFEFVDTANLYMFTRLNQDSAESPFTDTYHQLSIYSGQLKWTYEDSLLYVCTTLKTGLKTAIFESNEYFSMSRYNQLKGVDQVNPVVQLKKFWKEDSLNRNVFKASEFQKFIDSAETRALSEDQVHLKLFNLAKEGFVLYNPKTREAIIQPKLFKFATNKTGKTDYDVIQVTSKLDGIYGVNGIINLKTMDLRIISPTPTVLSYTKNVVFSADTITVKKNKDMKFNGTIEVGDTSLYQISGKDFKFNYNNFSFDLIKIDSINILAKDSVFAYRDSITPHGEKVKDSAKVFKLVKVASKMENTSATLNIDYADNKAGLQDKIVLAKRSSIINELKKNNSGRKPDNLLTIDSLLNEYPKFATTSNAYVYYDYTKDSADYPRSKFYFEVKPFKTPDLGNIEKSKVTAKGTFVSGLFEPLDSVTMTIQKDKSLGFNDIDFGTRDIYDGTYTGKLSMNNTDGLTGEGKIKYLTTTAHSKHFEFSPAKVTGKTDTIQIKPLTIDKIATVEHAQGDFPNVTSFTESQFDWIQKDSLIEVTNTKKGFEMFNGFANMLGEISILKTGLQGDGTFVIKDISKTVNVKKIEITEDATLVSSHFDFNFSTLTSDTTNFSILGKDEKIKAFEAFGYNSFVDVVKQTSYFTANYDTSQIHLDINQYLCGLDHYVFDMRLDSIYMGNGIDIYDDQKYFTSTKEDRDKMRSTLPENKKNKVRLTGSWFTSANPNQDSLNFYSEISTFDLYQNKITAKKVEIIEVADANIYPKGEYINIYRNAKMDVLSAAQIIAPRDSQYHVIKQAIVNINGKNDYTGSGEYTYPFNSQKFNFTDIRVDTTFQTIASTAIKAQDTLDNAFMLSPYFAFNGNINLFASNKYLEFAGYTSILNDCPDIKNEYLKFKAHINPDSVYIPIDSINTASTNGRILTAGLYINNPNVKTGTYVPYIYSTFTSPLQNQTAHKSIINANGFLYYDPKDTYYKISSYYKLKDYTLSGDYVRLHKKFCFLYAEGDLDLNANLGDLKIKTVGSVTNKIAEKQIVMETMMGISFYFIDRNLKIISDKLTDKNSYLDPIVVSTNSYFKNLVNWVGKDRATSLNDDQLMLFNGFDKVPKEFEAYTFMITDLKLNWDTLTNSFRSVGKIGISNIKGVATNKSVDGYLEIKKSYKGDEFTFFFNTSDNEWFYFQYSGEMLLSIGTDETYNSQLNNLKAKEKKQGKIELSLGDRDKALAFKKSFVP